MSPHPPPLGGSNVGSCRCLSRQWAWPDLLCPRAQTPAGMGTGGAAQGAAWGGWPPCAWHKLQRHFDDSDWFPRPPSRVLLTGPRTEADAVKRALGGVMGAAHFP